MRKDLYQMGGQDPLNTTNESPKEPPKLIPMMSIMESSLSSALKKLKQPKNSMGITTGLPAIDDILGGFQPPDFSIIAARPGIGKTAFIVNCLLSALTQQKRGVLFSLEMSNEQIVQRMIINRSEVDGSFLRTGGGQKSPQNIEMIEKKMTDAATVLYNQSAHLLLCDHADLDINTLTSLCLATEGIEIAFVDYLQLVKGGTESRKRDRHIEIGEVSRGLKTLAKTLYIPVVAAAQLRRVSENRTKKPVLNDLRESGSLEQDADQVVMIHRDLDEDGGISQEGEALLMIQKNRHGATGVAKVFYRGKHFKFKPESDENGFFTT